MPTREMLINYAPNEECRIAIVEDGRLEEFYQERASVELHVGNIYKGRVAHIEPAIQAAFIDFGLERNGFLHLSDLHPMYFGGASKEESERIGKKTPHRDRPPIQSCLRRGQDILVQVLKEGIGTKGPTVTSYLSIPGRFLVLLPYMERLGVSRKVEDDQSRHEMRNILDELDPPKDVGFIVRTAGIGRTKTDIKRDLAYLHRLWKTIQQRMKQTTGVCELYTESDLIIRTIRDVFSSDIDRIIVDDESAARRAGNFLSIASPRSGSTVTVYREPEPLFHRYAIEQQIENIHSRVVQLRSGGSLVIDSTEALVAIDVNSGKNRESRDAETTAFKINLEAADEVCRQLRLRDLGGVIVIDLIDMKPIKNRREIEQRFRNNLKRDRARTQICPISQFGILEMTRQRMRPSFKKSVYMDCPSCKGTGLVKSPESVLLDAMRRLAAVLHHSHVGRVDLTISPDVAFHLLNLKRSQLVALEQQHDKPVTVRVGGGSMDYIQLIIYDTQGAVIDADSLRHENGENPKVAAPATTIKQSNTGSKTTSVAVNPSGEKTLGGESTENKPRRRKRRRGGNRSKTSGGENSDTTSPDNAADNHVASSHDDDEANTDKTTTDNTSNPTQETKVATAGRSRRRRRRGGRGGGGGGGGTPSNPPADTTASSGDTAPTPEEQSPPRPKTRRRRRPSKAKSNTNVPAETSGQPSDATPPGSVPAQSTDPLTSPSE